MARRRLHLKAIVLLLIAGVAAYMLWPRLGPTAPDISERARQTPAQRADASLISADDLPPQGTRSLFDHLVAQNDALPYPFEKLVELIQRQHPEGKAPVTLMIPNGRSLLKAQADFRHPRVLVAADLEIPSGDAGLGLTARGRLFLGFVEDAREIEVLSYNEAAGRFEFQLVQDYAADGQRRIVYARRAVCTTCHQGAAPIFPQRPWNETSGQPEVSAKIAEANGGAQSYLGLPVYNELGVPERFDELTDIANFIPVTQRIWIDACAADNACRRLLLKLALRYAANPGGFDAAGPDAQKLRALQATTWPAAGIAEPQNDLANRDPLAERRGLRGFFRSVLAPKVEPGAGAKTNEDLEAFERLPKLPAAQDPLTPRIPKRVLTAGDLDGVYGVAALFTASDVKRLEQSAAFEWPKVEAAIDALPDALFAPAPLSRVRVMQALLPAGTDYCCLDTSEMSPPVAVGVPPLALAAGSPLLPFQEYCFACHRGNPARRLDFMGGASEAEVLAKIRDTASIRDALDWQRYAGTDKAGTLMPPADSPQRAKLEAALKTHPKLLEEMRAVVPAMFDF